MNNKEKYWLVKIADLNERVGGSFNKLFHGTSGRSQSSSEPSWFDSIGKSIFSSPSKPKPRTSAPPRSTRVMIDGHKGPWRKPPTINHDKPKAKAPPSVDSNSTKAVTQRHEQTHAKQQPNYKDMKSKYDSMSMEELLKPVPLLRNPGKK